MNSLCGKNHVQYNISYEIHEICKTRFYLPNIRLSRFIKVIKGLSSALKVSCASMKKKIVPFMV